MANHVYKSIELTGSSEQGIQQAIENAVAKAGTTIHNLHWFEVIETRGQIQGSKVAHWQVTLKVSFRVD